MIQPSNNRSEPNTNSDIEELLKHLPRILLLVLCAAALPALLNIHLFPKEVKHENVDTWQQPNILKQDIYPFINLHEGLSFIQLERQLSSLSNSSSGLVTINSNLLKVLEAVTGSLPTELSDSEREQIKTIVERSFPGAKGHQLSKLVEQHHRYEHTRVVGTQTAPERQAQFFGQQIANQLFRQQNELRAYLTERSDIRRNTAFSKAQKKEKLNQLERRFQLSRQTSNQESSK